MFHARGAHRWRANLGLSPEMPRHSNRRTAPICDNGRRVLLIAFLVSACSHSHLAATAPAIPAATAPSPPPTTASNYDAVRNGYWIPNACVWATSSPVPERRRHVAAPGGELTGVVMTDSKTPLSAAYVVLDSSAKQAVGTNEKGEFLIHHVTPGEHTIRVRAIGYLPARDTIIVDPQGASPLGYELRMDPPEKMAQCWHFEPARKPGPD